MSHVFLRPWLGHGGAAAGSLPMTPSSSRRISRRICAREDGLIGGIGLSGVTREHLVYAVGWTDIVCVQNQLNLADRTSMPVLEDCYARGIAFVPYFPLGSAFGNGLAAIRSVVFGAHLLAFQPCCADRPGT